MDTKLNLVFDEDLDLIRAYRLHEANKELLEMERKRLERKALYGKRRRKQHFKLHESGFYKSYLQEDKIEVLLDEKTRDAKQGASGPRNGSGAVLEDLRRKKGDGECWIRVQL